MRISRVILFGVLLSLLAVAAAFVGNVAAQGTWSEPSLDAPGGNTPAPFNASDVYQEKQGYLGAFDFFISSWYESDPSAPQGAYAGNLLFGERSDWKLLAKALNHTKEAQTTLSQSGVVTLADAIISNPTNAQRVNIGLFSWPHSTASVSEIVLTARNTGNDFCAGGNGVLDLSLANGIGPSQCFDRRCTGAACSYVSIAGTALDDWIRLVINGQVMQSCRGVEDILSGVGNPRYGRNTGTIDFGVVCHYIRDIDWFGNLDQIRVQEARLGAGRGKWEWEIWYRNYVKTGQPPPVFPTPP